MRIVHLQPLTPMPVHVFGEVAQRCGLECDMALLRRLHSKGIVPAFDTEERGGDGMYMTAHLWLLARYLDAVRVYRHPWAKFPMTLSKQAVLVLKAAAGQVFAALATRRHSPAASVPSQGPMVAALDRFIGEHDPLGSLHEALPLMRDDIRGSLKGDALLTMLLKSARDALVVDDGSTVAAVPVVLGGEGGSVGAVSAPMSLKPAPTTLKPAPAPSFVEAPMEDAAEAPAEPDTHVLTGAPDPSALKAALDRASEDGDAPMLSLDELELAPVDEGGGDAAEDAESKPKLGGLGRGLASKLSSKLTSGLGSGLASRLKSKTPTPPPQTPSRLKSKAPTPVADQPVGGGLLDGVGDDDGWGTGSGALDDLLPSAPASPPPIPEPEPEPKGPTLEEQIEELNTLREQYMAEEKWTELIALYRDRFDLFQTLEDQRKVLMNIGLLHEVKLKAPDDAIDVYAEALELGVVEASEEALVRMLEPMEADAAAERLEALIAQAQSPDARAMMQTELLKRVAGPLNDQDRAVKLLGEVALSGLNRDARDARLGKLAAWIQDATASPKVLLAAGSVIEGFWQVDTHGEPLQAIYDAIAQHAGFLGEEEQAAEALVRLASVHQANGNDAEAFRKLGQALAMSPEREDVLHRLERLATALGQEDEWAILLEDALDASTDEAVRLKLARRLSATLEARGDIDGAVRAWEAISEADQGGLEALGQMFKLYEARDDVVAQLSVLERLRDRLEGSSRLRVLLKLAGVRSAGLAPEANARAKAVLDVDAAQDMIEEVLGEVAPDAQEAQDAVELSLRLIRQGPPALGYALAERLESYHAQNDQSASIPRVFESLARALLRSPEQRPEAVGTLMRVGTLHAEHTQDTRSMFAAYGQVLRLKADHAEARRRLLTLLEQDPALWELAAPLFEELTHNTDDIELLRVMATAYNGQPDGARDAARVYARILRADPHDAAALAFLEEHHKTHQDWSMWVEIQRARIQAAPSTSEKRALTMKLIQTALTEAKRPDLVTEVTRDVLRQISPRSEPYKALDRWYDGPWASRAWAALLYERVEQTEPGIRKQNYQIRYALVMAEKLDAPDEAIRVLTEVRDAWPDDTRTRLTVLRLLVRLLSAQERHLEAYGVLQDLADELVKYEHEDEGIGDELDRALTRLGRMAETVLKAPEQATAHYGALLKRQPNNLQLLQHLIRLYAHTQDYEALLAALEQHLTLSRAAKDAQSIRMLTERIVAVTRDHLKDPAREYAALHELVTVRGAARPADLERLADLARAQGNWEASIRHTEEYIERLKDRDDMAAMYLELAELAEKHLKDPRRAFAYLDRAVKVKPDQPDVMRKLAEHYKREDDAPKLAEVMRAMLDHKGMFLPQDYIICCLDLAELLADRLDDPHQAVGFVERAITRLKQLNDPGDLEFRLRRLGARLYRRLGASREAMTHLQILERRLQAANATPQQMAGLYQDLGLAASDGNQRTQAVRYLRQAAELDRFNGFTRLLLAEVLMQDRASWDESRQTFEAVLRSLDDLDTDQQRARAFAGLGQLYGLTGKVGKAAEMYRRALDIDPENAVARKAMS